MFTFSGVWCAAEVNKHAHTDAHIDICPHRLNLHTKTNTGQGTSPGIKPTWYYHSSVGPAIILAADKWPPHPSFPVRECLLYGVIFKAKLIMTHAPWEGGSPCLFQHGTSGRRCWRLATIAPGPWKEKSTGAGDTTLIILTWGSSVPHVDDKWHER